MAILLGQSRGAGTQVCTTPSTEASMSWPTTSTPADAYWRITLRAFAQVSAVAWNVSNIAAGSVWTGLGERGCGKLGFGGRTAAPPPDMTDWLRGCAIRSGPRWAPCLACGWAGRGCCNTHPSHNASCRPRHCGGCLRRTHAGWSDE